MAKLLAAPSKNAIQKTLSAQLLSTAGVGDPISFDDVDGLANLPGVLVINRVNSSGVATPSSREYIEYSGTSGTTVLITTRNVDGGNAAVTHPVGSIVEFIPDVIWADRMYDALATLVDVNDISAINTGIVTLTGSQTLTNKTLTSPIANTPTLVTPIVKTAYSMGTVGATETVNWANGDLQTLTMDENLTITFSNAVAGQRLTLFMLQDGTGTNTITWADTIVWQDATTPTWTTTADKMNVAVIYYSGSAYFGMGSKFA